MSLFSIRNIILSDGGFRQIGGVNDDHRAGLVHNIRIIGNYPAEVSIIFVGYRSQGLAFTDHVKTD